MDVFLPQNETKFVTTFIGLRNLYNTLILNLLCGIFLSVVGVQK